MVLNLKDLKDRLCLLLHFYQTPFLPFSPVLPFSPIFTIIVIKNIIKSAYRKLSSESAGITPEPGPPPAPAPSTQTFFPFTILHVYITVLPSPSVTVSSAHRNIGCSGERDSVNGLNSVCSSRCCRCCLCLCGYLLLLPKILQELSASAVSASPNVSATAASSAVISSTASSNSIANIHISNIKISHYFYPPVEESSSLLSPWKSTRGPGVFPLRGIACLMYILLLSSVDPPPAPELQIFAHLIGSNPKRSRELSRPTATAENSCASGRWSALNPQLLPQAVASW